MPSTSTTTSVATGHSATLGNDGPSVETRSVKKANPMDTAMVKVARAAAYHNPRTAGLAGLSGFQGGAMTPAQFREQLFIAFGMKLTDDELHSLMSDFDADLSGKVDGAEFLVQFFKIGARVRSITRPRTTFTFRWG